jgi:hypothetical protein
MELKRPGSQDNDIYFLSFQVIRHPDHVPGSGIIYWAHHEKIVSIDQKISFLGGKMTFLSLKKINFDDRVSDKSYVKKSGFSFKPQGSQIHSICNHSNRYITFAFL